MTSQERIHKIIEEAGTYSYKNEGLVDSLTVGSWVLEE